MRLKNHLSLRAASISLVVLILFAGYLSAAIAAGKLVIHVNKGIGTATLGSTQDAAVKAIGTKPTKTGKDTEYEGRIVYFAKYGKPNKSNEYPLEVYSETKKKIVFMFIMNSTSYATDEGIKVGSKEAALTKAYGKKLTSKKSRLYTKYSLGTKTGTDFYVKKGLVTQIVVRKF